MPIDTSTLFEQPPPPERQLVLFFDECVGRPHMERLVQFLSNRPEHPRLVHLLDLYAQGISDKEWAARAKAEGWLPITADRGKSNKGAKLPRVCKDLGLVHIVLSANVHNMKAVDQALAIVAVWQDIVRAWREQKGCRFSLRKGDRSGFRLIDVDRKDPS